MKPIYTKMWTLAVLISLGFTMVKSAAIELPHDEDEYETVYSSLKTEKLYGIDKKMEDYKLGDNIPNAAFLESFKIFLKKFSRIYSDFSNFNFAREDHLVVRVKSFPRPLNATFDRNMGVGYVKYLKAPVTEADTDNQRIVTVKELDQSYNEYYHSDIMVSSYQSFYPYVFTSLSNSGVVISKKITTSVSVEEDEIIVLFVPIFASDKTSEKFLIKKAVELINANEETAIKEINEYIGQKS